MKSDYEKGLCPKCKGFIQYDKINDYLYCVDCHATWDSGEWEYLVDKYKEEEYEVPDVDDNLSALNNLRLK